MSETRHKNPKKETPKKWSSAKDPRAEKKAGKYPHQIITKTRSGNIPLMVDDTPGHESMTIQHRSGSAFQFLPDGSVQVTAHHGKYDLVFGENRLTVTGAHDLTVKGHGSMMVYGDYNKTIHGDVNYTVTGSYNITADTHNAVIRNNMDVAVGGNKTTKVAGSESRQIKKSFALASGEDATVASKGGTLNFGAEKQLSLFTNDQLAMKGKSIASEAKEGHDMTVGSDMKVKVAGAYHNNTQGDSYRTTGGSSHAKTSGTHYADASTRRYQEGSSQQAQQAQKPDQPQATASNNPDPGGSGNKPVNYLA